jgi:hypothetical protein
MGPLAGVPRLLTPLALLAAVLGLVFPSPHAATRSTSTRSSASKGGCAHRKSTTSLGAAGACVTCG